MNKGKNLDQVILVDKSDRVLGAMDKVDAHKGQGQMHRAVSVFLFNQEGKLLVQQRSEYKIVAALQWANTACGNVRPNESRRQCAQRRLRQELGITGVKLTSLGKLAYHTSFDNGFSEREIDEVYIGFWQGEPQLNPREVKAVDWLELDQVILASSQENWAPWLKHIFNQPQILNSLKNSKKHD